MRYYRGLCWDLIACFLSGGSEAPWRSDSLSHVRRHLVPISRFRNELSVLQDDKTQTKSLWDENGCYVADNGEIYQLGLAEEEDLPDVARFVVASFGADAIRASQDFGALERLLLQPVVDVVNGYSGLVAFAEVLSGLQQRLSGRLQQGRMDLSPPPMQGLSETEQVRAAASHAIVLVLAKKRAGSDWQMDIIASVELAMQLCDAKIPFTLPWLDEMERQLGSWLRVNADGESTMVQLQPYLSNLCVDEAFRGQGIGRALVQCVEDIASTSWKASRVYLHVDPENEAAFQLYKKVGYQDAERRWRPVWAGKAADIGYYVKKVR